MIESDNFNFDEEVAKFNDVIFNQSNEVKAKILTGYLSSIIDVEIKHFDDFNDHKTVLKDIESKVTFAINMLKQYKINYGRLNNFLSRSSVKYSLMPASIFSFSASSSILLSKYEPSKILRLVSFFRSCSFCFAFSRASLACFLSFKLL